MKRKKARASSKEKNLSQGKYRNFHVVVRGLRRVFFLSRVSCLTGGFVFFFPSFSSVCLVLAWLFDTNCALIRVCVFSLAAV